MDDTRFCTVCGRTLRDPASRARRQLLPVGDVPAGPYL
ncbi:DUF6011 domain-containing protein [Streptomyces microflavus]